MLTRTLVVVLTCLTATAAFGDHFIFTELEIPQPRSITPDVIALLPDRRVFFLDAAVQKMGIFPLDGGLPVIVPIPAPDGERVDAEDAVAGPDSAVWFIAQMKKQDGTERSVIGRTPFDLSTTEYFNIPTSTACSALQDCQIVLAPDSGSLFFTETREGRIGRLTLDRVFTEFPIRLNSGVTPNVLAGIAWGTDGNIYTTAPINNSVIRMTPQGRTTDFRIGPGRHFVDPQAIVGHRNGNMYLTTDDKGLAELTPMGVITEFSLPTTNGDPIAIAVGADDNVYVAQRRSKTVSQLNPITTDVLEVAITNGDTPTDIVTVPGATAERTELVINGYNASFDYTPQKLTVGNATTPPNNPPDLALDKRITPGPVAGNQPRTDLRAGEEFSYFIDVFNLSDTVTEGEIKITDPLPQYIEFRGATIATTPDGKEIGSCDLLGGSVICTTEQKLGKEGTIRVTISVKVLPFAVGEDIVLPNTATVTGGGDGNDSNNSGTFTVSSLLDRARHASEIEIIDAVYAFGPRVSRGPQQ